jgi:hypothetical protein
LQVQYGQEMVKHHDEGYDWQKELINLVVVHASGGGKAHGW